MNPQTQPLIAQLRALREERKLSQRALAKQLDMPQSYISNVESGKVEIGLANFLEIVRYLGGEIVIVPPKLVPTIRAMTLPTGLQTSHAKPRWAVDPDWEQ